MAAGAILAITIVPVLMGYFIRGKMKKEDENPITRFLMDIYHPVVDFVMKTRWWIIGISIIVVALTYIPFSKLGSEFMPPFMKEIFSICRPHSRNFNHKSQGDTSTDRQNY